MLNIEQSLMNYDASPDEGSFKKDILHLIKIHGDKCLSRDLFDPGHITGSALLVSHDKKHVLMNHHKKLDKWLCFGGHADGEADILNVARREVEEESGITDIVAVSHEIFDIDVHVIPETEKEKQHFHFDIRYLFCLTDKRHENFVVSDESNNLKWCDYQEACTLLCDNGVGMLRLLTKWHENF